MDYEIPKDVKDNLKEGNWFFLRNRMTPMPSKSIQKVKNIYQKCLGGCIFGDTPLIVAASLGLDYMVWGFLECAKQTNMDLHTGVVGEFQQFLGRKNYNGDTALHVAAKNDHDHVVKVLLANASLEFLISDRNENGKTPLSLLRHPQNDKFILETLEARRAELLHPPASTSILIDNKQESKVYSDSIMDSNSYPKSHKGNTRKSLEKLDHDQLELSANENTILHLVANFGDVEYVKDILKKHPSLVYLRNSNWETPAYVAARDGHLDILAMMINHLKTKDDDIEQLVTRSMDKNTALHIAIQNHRVGVVFLLIKEVPQLANYINDFGESSLYLAAERGYHAILKLMADNCKEKAFDGPNGKTALHAAAISGSSGNFDP